MQRCSGWLATWGAWEPQAVFWQQQEKALVHLPAEFVIRADCLKCSLF